MTLITNDTCLLLKVTGMALHLNLDGHLLSLVQGQLGIKLDCMITPIFLLRNLSDQQWRVRHLEQSR